MALTSSAFAENVIQVTPANYEAGKTVYFSVEMNNEELIAGCAFDLYLPTGFSMGAISAIYPSYNDEASDYQAPTNGSRNAFYDSDGGVYLTAMTMSKTNDYNATGEYENGGTCVRFAFLSTDGYNFSGTEGQIARFQVKVPSDAKGVYPVILRNISMKGVEGMEYYIPVATSYITVGDVADASLSIEGVIPSFVNSALANQKGITSLDLTNLKKSNGVFTYVDGRDVVAPSAAVSAEVAYKHSAGSNSYCSVCLPFDATVANAFTYDKIEDGAAKFVEAATLTAGTSAIVKGDIDVTATVDLAAVAGETITTGYYLKNDKFLSVNGSAVIPAMRGNWKSISGVKGFVIDGEETAINAIDAEGAQDIYSVAGIKQAKVQKGVNIVNGKKLYVK